jgi:periplasmic protein TonB
MPQELLRDVLRTGDAPERARRRLPILPISIAAHAVAVAAIVIIPLGASVELPPIASPFDVREYVKTVQPPSPPPPRQIAPVQPSRGAPTTAPPTVARELEHAPPPPQIGITDRFGDSTSNRFLNEIGTPTGVIVAPPPPPPPPPPVQQKPVRVGPGIREPKKIVHVVPEYPEIARTARVEGVVILEAVLDTTGRVQSVRVLRSVPLLDMAAINAVRQWRYTPTELNGVPVPVLMTITVQFTLAR